ncbi:MAG: PAS domain S-box protein [Nitrospirae bacterium]|nr:PAS domain S-box protein [Nitrospirota bacterium]
METPRSAPRLNIASSFKIFIFFLTIFFVLLLLYDQSLLFSSRKQFDLQEKQLLLKEMADIKTDLLVHLKEAQEDPYYLYALGSKTKLRITLFNKDASVVRDSNGKIKSGEHLDSIGVFPITGLWKGEPVFSSNEENQKEVVVYGDLLSPAGLTPLGIRIVQEREVAGSPEGETYLFFLKLFGAVGLFTLGLTVYRYLREIFKKESFFEGTVQDTNPVLYTFQGLLQELKIKEHELEKLKEQAENRAVQSETFQEAILRSINSGVITFNKNQGITSYNESAARIFGIPRQEAIGKKCSEVFGTENKIQALLNQTIRENETIERAEFEMIKGKSQEKIWIGVSASFLTNPLGEFLGTTFIFTDITEIKALQEQVELQKRLTVLGEMSAGIAHEFRNFMGTIFGYVRLLGKKVEKTQPDHQMIEAIITELKSMDHLIHELLGFGKNTPVNKGKVLLEPFFSRLITQLSSQYKGVLPKISCDIANPSLAVSADEILIRQAFVNLIQNAFEAMPEGGVLSIKAGINPIEKNSMVLVQIKDTGTGISKDHLEKIFVPFFTQKAKGTGLGLAIVHKIILSHGGRIRVESEEGKGTLFKIYLPKSSE